jgi:hypothetical protein
MERSPDVRQRASDKLLTGDGRREMEAEDFPVTAAASVSTEAGLITHFKVMVRPLKAIDILHPKMGEYLMKV